MLEGSERAAPGALLHLDSLIDIDGTYMPYMLIIAVGEDFSHAQRDLYVLKSPGLPKICHQSDVKLFTVTKPMSTAVMTPRRQERCLCLVEPASA